MLEAQCKSWGGPVSAAVYVPLKYFDHSNSEIIDEAVQQLEKLFGRIERAGKLDLQCLLGDLATFVFRPNCSKMLLLCRYLSARHCTCL